MGVAAPSGSYEGSVPFIIDITMDIKSATSADVDINIKVAHQDVNCPGEVIAMTATAITFPNSGNTGDCIGDGVRSQKKDPSKYSLDINSDGSLTMHSDGYPDMKLTKKSFAVAAPSGSYEGSVPFIIAISLDITSATAADLDINIKIAHQEVKCPGETIAMTATAITFPNTATTGDCMGDALRGQKKDPSKYSLDINSDGSLTFHSDGYPDMKLNKKSLAVAAPSGKYEGSVPFIIDITLDIASATVADLDINIKVAHQVVKCPTEAI